MSVAFVNYEMELSWEIEQMREEMRNLAVELGFLHPDVVSCSERLDVLLMQYYTAMQRSGT